MAKSIVTSIGEMALSFEEDKVLIFYGPGAPPELKEFAIIHEFEDKNGLSLEEGGMVVINGHQYQLVAVGSDADKNLSELGHISVYFSEKPTDILPGAVYVEPQTFPKVTVGSAIEFK